MKKLRKTDHRFKTPKACRLVPQERKNKVVKKKPVGIVESPRNGKIHPSVAAEPRVFAPLDNPLDQYLREVSQYRLITVEEECALARRIHRGDKRARETMITANLRLVVKIAVDYQDIGLSLLDLINEGNIGLMKGVERFDPTKGAKLSTYASWWIRQSIKRALANQSKTIRLPMHIVDKVFRLRRVAFELYETLNREPTDEELADELGMSQKTIRRLRHVSQWTVSLEAPLTSDGTVQVSDFMEDTQAVIPSEKVASDNDVQLLGELLSTLVPREREILCKRFGLDGRNTETLKDVGKHFDVTRERIRQIEKIALRKLRAAARRLENTAWLSH